MAELCTYRCNKCGYEVQTEAPGHYALMSGLYFNFHCLDCKEIVDLSAEEIGKSGYFITCPECGSERLESWSVHSRCPKCYAHGCFEEVPGSIMMAD